MTIKKLNTSKSAAQPNAAAAPDDAGVADLPTDAAAPKVGATIADRFKLDAPDPSAKGGSTSKKAAQIALAVGLIALAVAGILTFILYQHWEFLKDA